MSNRRPHRLNLLGLVFSLFAFAGCQAGSVGLIPLDASTFDDITIPAPLINVSERRADLLSLTIPEQDRYCDFERRRKVRAPKVVEIYSGDVSTAATSTDPFMVDLHYLVADAVRQDNLAKTALLRSELVRAADKGALLKVQSYHRSGGNPYNEPIFHQAITLIPLSYAMEVLVDAYGWGDPGVQKIKAWGDEIYRAAESGRDNLAKGPDRRAGKAAAFAMWGTATGNMSTFRSGFGHFRRASGRTIASDGSFRGTAIPGVSSDRRLYYANLTFGFLVLAADALRKAGMEDALTFGNEAGSVASAASWLMATAAQWNKDGRGDTTFYSRRNSWGSRSLGWVEVYLAAVPESPYAIIVAKNYPWREQGSVFSAFYGGWTKCLFRAIENPKAS